MNSVSRRIHSALADSKLSKASWVRVTAWMIVGSAMAMGLAGCGDYSVGRVPAAVVVRAADPVRLAPTKRADVVGFVFSGMRFPVTAKAENCEFLRITTPWWGEVWIIGPPEFALIDGGGCAALPDASLGREPQG